MNNVILPLLISTLAGLSTFIGGLLVFVKFKDKNKFLAFILSFSSSIMISISVLDLIPTSFIALETQYGLFKSLLITISIFILGLLIILYLSKKITLLKSKNNLYRVGVLSMIALAIHNFPEGIATFMSSYNDLSIGINLAIAIALHNIPEGISISIPIYYSTNKKSRGLIYSLLSGLSEPLGALLAYILLKNIINSITIAIILIFVAGLMISLAINELLPEAQSYNNRKENIIGFILGIVIVFINVLVL